jgi:hypothetical protein
MFGMGLAMALGVAVPSALAAMPCVGTAGDAVRVYRSGAVVGAASADGYRVTGVRRDDVLPVWWAMEERCGHPGWPAVSVAMDGPGEGVARFRNEGVPVAARARMQVAVRAGETVRVWRHEANVQLEMAAVSEESGAVGDRIRLHVATGNGEPVRYCFGLVRGLANVEME